MSASQGAWTCRHGVDGRGWCEECHAPAGFPKRYAIVRNADSYRQVESYLPSNYTIAYEGAVNRYPGEWKAPWADGFVIEGYDDHGWTLDGYVIPRFASGLIWVEEIDLSHPLMKQVPA